MQMQEAGNKPLPVPALRSVRRFLANADAAAPPPPPSTAAAEMDSLAALQNSPPLFKLAGLLIGSGYTDPRNQARAAAGFRGLGRD